MTQADSIERQSARNLATIFLNPSSPYSIAIDKTSGARSIVYSRLIYILFYSIYEAKFDEPYQGTAICIHIVQHGEKYFRFFIF